MMAGMEKKQSKPLYEKTQSEVLNEWRTARARHFRILNETGKSLQDIGGRYGITRQAVSALIKLAESQGLID